MPQAAGCVLAFDYGLKHIGVAVGQTITRTASPLATIPARNGNPEWSAVDRLVDEWQPSRVLVGLPLNMDDTESEMSERARGFARQLAGRTGLEVIMVDERLTSYASRHTDDSHSAAAALIAETWLNDDR